MDNHSHHDHAGHGHHHHVNVADMSGKAFVIGIMLNGGYVVAQVIAGFATNSMALIADAGHNLGDVAGLLLSLIAFRLNKVKASQQYTYGYKKTTILSALGNAVILLLAIGTLGYESIRRLGHPEPVQGGIVAWVAGLGIVINAGSALLFFRTKDHELNSRGAYLHLLSDALVSLGVVVAGVIIAFTHWYWLDAVISIAVLAITLVGTWGLLVQSLRLSMDGVPNGVDFDKITTVIKGVKGVEHLHHLHIWAMSTTENALTTHVVLDGALSFEDKMKVIHNIKHELAHNKINHATIELESPELPCGNNDC